MSDNLAIGLVGSVAGSLRIPSLMTNSRNPVVGMFVRIVRWYVPTVARHATIRVTQSLADVSSLTATALAGLHPAGRLVPQFARDAAWPLTSDPLRTAFRLGVDGHAIQYEAGRMLARAYGSGTIVPDLVFYLGARVAGVRRLFLRLWRIALVGLGVGAGVAIVVVVLALARAYAMRTWRQSAQVGYVAPALHNGLAVVNEDVRLDEDVENELLEEQDIPNRHPGRFVRRCALWCKANFTCTPERRTAAQLLVVREGLARVLRQRNVRNAHIANVLDTAVELAFIPSDVELEGAKLVNSDLFKSRRVEAQVAKQSWWSFAINKVWLILGHQGSVTTNP